MMRLRTISRLELFCAPRTCATLLQPYSAAPQSTSRSPTHAGPARTSGGGGGDAVAAAALTRLPSALLSLPPVAAATSAATSTAMPQTQSSAARSCVREKTSPKPQCESTMTVGTVKASRMQMDVMSVYWYAFTRR